MKKMKKLNMKTILLGAAVIGCFIFYPNTTALTAAAEESGCDNMDITQDDSTTMASEGDIAVKNDKTPPKAKAVYKTKKYKYKNKAGKTIKGVSRRIEKFKISDQGYVKSIVIVNSNTKKTYEKTYSQKKGTLKQKVTISMDTIRKKVGKGDCTMSIYDLTGNSSSISFTVLKKKRA